MGVKYTIEDLRNGKVALRNDGTLQQLEEILRFAFPQDSVPIRPHYQYLYFFADEHEGKWACTDSLAKTKIPCQQIQLFINELAEHRQLVIVNESIERLIGDLKRKVSEIGLDVEFIFKHKNR
jgi:hypothetical protein